MGEPDDWAGERRVGARFRHPRGGESAAKRARGPRVATGQLRLADRSHSDGLRGIACLAAPATRADRSTDGGGRRPPDPSHLRGMIGTTFQARVSATIARRSRNRHLVCAPRVDPTEAGVVEIGDGREVPGIDRQHDASDAGCRVGTQEVNSVGDIFGRNHSAKRAVILHGSRIALAGIESNCADSGCCARVRPPCDLMACSPSVPSDPMPDSTTPISFGSYDAFSAWRRAAGTST